MFITICLLIIEKIIIGSSSVEKSDDLTKAEWLERIGSLHMQRADMNRLIMNYLVTGMLFNY